MVIMLSLFGEVFSNMRFFPFLFILFLLPTLRRRIDKHSVSVALSFRDRLVMSMRQVIFSAKCRLILDLPGCTLYHMLFFVRLHQKSFIASFIINLAEKLKASLMHCSNLLHRQVKVDTQNHDFVALNSNDNRENYKSTHHNENAEKYESWH